MNEDLHVKTAIQLFTAEGSKRLCDFSSRCNASVTYTGLTLRL